MPYPAEIIIRTFLFFLLSFFPFHVIRLITLEFSDHVLKTSTSAYLVSLCGWCHQINNFKVIWPPWKFQLQHILFPYTVDVLITSMLFDHALKTSTLAHPIRQVFGISRSVLLSYFMAQILFHITALYQYLASTFVSLTFLNIFIRNDLSDTLWPYVAPSKRGSIRKDEMNISHDSLQSYISEVKFNKAML